LLTTHKVSPAVVEGSRGLVQEKRSTGDVAQRENITGLEHVEISQHCVRQKGS